MKKNAKFCGEVVLPRGCHNLSGANHCPPQETALALLDSAQAVSSHVLFHLEKKKTPKTTVAAGAL